MRKATVAIAFGLLVLGALLANHACKADKEPTDVDKAKHGAKKGEKNAKSPNATSSVTYCPQFFEYQMNSGGTTYYYYRCQICDPPPSNPDDCVYNDVMTTQMYSTGGFCDDCGGGCVQPFSFETKGVHSSRASGEFPPPVDHVGQSNWKKVDYGWAVTNVDPKEDPHCKPKTALNEYYVPVSINSSNYSFRCVEVIIPGTPDRLRVGIEIDPSLPHPTPANSGVKNVTWATNTAYVGPETTGDQYHHRIVVLDGNDVKLFHVVTVTPIN